MKVVRYILGFVLVLSLGFVLGWYAGTGPVRTDGFDTSNPTSNGTSEVRPASVDDFGVVRVMVDDGDGIKTFSGVPVVGETALDFLENMFEAEGVDFGTKEFPGIGVLVELIGDKSNGEDGKYWQYWVNGAFASVGVHALELRPRDIMLWQFAKDHGL
mgnify:CR=1 FL=1